MHQLDEFKKFQMLVESADKAIKKIDNEKPVKEGRFRDKIMNMGLTPDRHNITGKKTRCKSCGYDLRTDKNGRVTGHANFKDDSNCKNPIAESVASAQKKLDAAKNAHAMIKEKIPSKSTRLKSMPLERAMKRISKAEKELQDAKAIEAKKKKPVKESKCCPCKSCKCDCHK